MKVSATGAWGADRGWPRRKGRPVLAPTLQSSCVLHDAGSEHTHQLHDIGTALCWVGDVPGATAALVS
jgi:hypothetical protein